MKRIEEGDTVRIVSGPAAGLSGIVTRIKRGRVQVVNLYRGTSYSTSVKELVKVEPGADLHTSPPMKDNN